MKISKLIALLEQRKEEFGDVDVRVWDEEECRMTPNILVNDFLSDYEYGNGRAPHYVGISTVLEDE